MKVDFKNFLDRFPKIELPVTLRDDSHHDFEQNDPLQAQMITDFVAHYEAVEPDEFTEYIACFQLPQTRQLAGEEQPKKTTFHAVMYFKASLLQYDFVLATYSPTGVMIDKKAIAGMKVVGDKVRQTVATIDEKFSIFTAEGAITEGDEFYDANATKPRRFEILEDGRLEQEY